MLLNKLLEHDRHLKEIHRSFTGFLLNQSCLMVLGQSDHRRLERRDCLQAFLLFGIELCQLFGAKCCRCVKCSGVFSDLLFQIAISVFKRALLAVNPSMAAVKSEMACSASAMDLVFALSLVSHQQPMVS
jgi:hypothetical protein